MIAEFKPRGENNSLFQKLNQRYLPAIPHPKEGRTRRHERWAREAMDAFGFARRAEEKADGQVVWSRSPDAGIKPADDDSTGDGG